MHPARGCVPFVARPTRPSPIHVAPRASALAEQIRLRDANPYQATKFKIQETVLKQRFAGKWSIDTPRLSSNHVEELSQQLSGLGFNAVRRDGSTVQCGSTQFATTPCGLVISLPDRIVVASEIMMKRQQKQEGWNPIFRADFIQRAIQKRAESHYQILSAKIASKLPTLEKEPLIIDITGEWLNVIAWVVEDLQAQGYKIKETGPREYNFCNETEGFHQLIISLE